jgi:hypothetical protein
MQVLAKSNSSRFGKFIMNMYFNRKEDKYKVKSRLLVEKLQTVESFRVFIEEQDEEAF